MSLLARQMTTENFMAVARLMDEDDPATPGQAVQGFALINWLAGVLDAVNGVAFSVPQGAEPEALVRLVRDSIDLADVAGDRVAPEAIVSVTAALMKKYPRG